MPPSAGWWGLTWLGPRPLLGVKRRPWLDGEERVQTGSGGGGGWRERERGICTQVKGSPRRNGEGERCRAGSEGGQGGGRGLFGGSLAVDTRGAGRERSARRGWRDNQSGAKRRVGGAVRGELVGGVIPGGVAPPGQGWPGLWGDWGGAKPRSPQGGVPGVCGRRVGHIPLWKRFDPGRLGGPWRSETRRR